MPFKRKWLGGFFRSWLLTEEWNGEGGGRDDLGEQEEEDGEREEDRYAQGDLQGITTGDGLMFISINTSKDCIEQLIKIPQG